MSKLYVIPRRAYHMKTTNQVCLSLLMIGFFFSFLLYQRPLSSVCLCVFLAKIKWGNKRSTATKGPIKQPAKWSHKEQHQVKLLNLPDPDPSTVSLPPVFGVSDSATLISAPAFPCCNWLWDFCTKLVVASSVGARDLPCSCSLFLSPLSLVYAETRYLQICLKKNARTWLSLRINSLLLESVQWRSNHCELPYLSLNNARMLAEKMPCSDIE